MSEQQEPRSFFYSTPEDEELRMARIRQQEDEREAAYRAVSKALTTYRWWGYTSISIAIRMFITACRIRFGMKLWP